MVFRVLDMGSKKAVKYMKEVHELGKSILWTGERGTGRKLCLSTAEVEATGGVGKG